MHKTRLIVTSLCKLSICFLFLTPYAYSNDVPHKVAEKERANMISELLIVRDSSENKEFPIFRELINTSIKKGDFSTEEYTKLLSLNESKIFKQSLQMERQDLEDMRIQMQLQYMQPQE